MINIGYKYHIPGEGFNLCNTTGQVLTLKLNLIRTESKIVIDHGSLFTGHKRYCRAFLTYLALIIDLRVALAVYYAPTDHLIVCIDQFWILACLYCGSW